MVNYILERIYQLYFFRFSTFSVVIITEDLHMMSDLGIF